MARTQPSISVVMPYYRNERTLPECLARLAQQTMAPKEIIVVDDGSQQPALPLIEAHRRAYPQGPIVHHHLSAHGGQSKATNIGIAAATGDITLLTCADILAHPSLVGEHCRAHCEQTDEVGVMGNIPYADTVEMTPFMQWLCMPMRQFCFSLITDPENVSANFCYSPNISLSTAILQQLGGFDEQFIYGYQDTDLGLRLNRRGMRFVYRKHAIGFHDHPNDVRAFAKRQWQVGVATLTMMEKYPNPKQQALLRGRVHNHWGHVGKLPTLLTDIESLEGRLRKAPHLIEPVRTQLVNLYDFTMALALVDGMLRYPQRLHHVLEYGDTVPPFLACAPAPTSPSGDREALR